MRVRPTERFAWYGDTRHDATQSRIPIPYLYTALTYQVIHAPRFLPQTCEV